MVDNFRPFELTEFYLYREHIPVELRAIISQYFALPLTDETIHVAVGDWSFAKDRVWSYIMAEYFKGEYVKIIFEWSIAIS